METGIAARLGRKRNDSGSFRMSHEINLWFNRGYQSFPPHVASVFSSLGYPFKSTNRNRVAGVFSMESRCLQLDLEEFDRGRG